jgi:hypothetical protein
MTVQALPPRAHAGVVERVDLKPQVWPATEGLTQTSYAGAYKNILLTNYPGNKEKEEKEGKPPVHLVAHIKPTAWGFHDYEDIVENVDTQAVDFARYVSTRLGKPKLFMTEAGVLLQNGAKETEVLEADKPVKLKAHAALQAAAAERFLTLAKGVLAQRPHYPIQRMNYYQYTSPPAAQQAKHFFDSALLEHEESGPRIERPAYCILAYASKTRPPVITTEKAHGGRPVEVSVCRQPLPNTPVKGVIEPQGGKVFKYRFKFEYYPVGSDRRETGYTEWETVKAVNPWAHIEVNGEIPALGGSGDSERDCPESMPFTLKATNEHGQTSLPHPQVIEFVVAL